jgi:predicted dehydrogenase
MPQTGEGSQLKELTSALIGTGAIARSLHLPAHRRLTGSLLKWVCNTSAQSARSAAEEFGVPLWTVRLEDVLNDSSVDWVDVAVPNEHHEAVTIRCLEAGKHVLCQKPMAPTVEATERMTAAAERAGRQLGIYMCFRGDPAVRLIRDLVRQGRFGKLISLRGKMISDKGLQLQPGQWRMEGASGALDLLGVHLIDLFSWIYSEIEWAQAYSATLHAPMKGDDVTTAVYGLSGGVTAVLETTYCSYLNEHTPLYTLEVNGTDGTAVYAMDHGRLSLQLKEDYRSDSFTYQAGTWNSYKFEHALWGGGSLPQVHQDFVHALLAGKPFDIGGDAGSRAIRVVEATRKAALTGKRIHLN